MKKKWTLFTFSRGDFKALEQYLNEQADRGWELEKTGIFAKWKRTQRTGLRYCVDLAKPKQDREDRLDYVEFCREGGWELVAFTGQMYIFKSLPGAGLIPVQTDPELERKQYNKYYIWNTILSVAVLALYFGFWLAVGSALGGNWGEGLAELRNQWMTSWIAAGFLCGLPFWGVWAVWKLIDFGRAVVKGRTGTLGRSPRWVLWLNNILAFAAGIGAVFFFLGDILDLLAGEELNITILIFLFIWGGTLLYQALSIEKELFKGERRRHIVGGAALIAAFALLIVGRVVSPCGEWSISMFSMDKEKGVEVYEQTHARPLVHGEDVGIAFEPENGEAVYITGEMTPMGETWELFYVYGDEKTDFRLLKLGCATTKCFTEGSAKLLLGMLADTPETDHYYSVWPVKGLTRVEIEWADEAWYGTIPAENGEDISVLALRVGKRVARMVYPADLMSEENLEIIRGELSK